MSRPRSLVLSTMCKKLQDNSLCHGKINGVDYSTSLFVSCRQPCHGEMHGVDYSTSLFVSCCRPCHGEMYSVDYNTSLFVLCRQPCHGELHGVDYSTSLFVSCRRPCHGEIVNARKAMKRTENYRLRRDIALAAGVLHNIDKQDNQLCIPFLATLLFIRTVTL